MITPNMKEYVFYNYSNAQNAYGELIINTRIPHRALISISLISKSVQDNIQFTEADYIGFTLDNNICDKSVVLYTEDINLKVLYVNKGARFNIVYLKRM